MPLSCSPSLFPLPRKAKNLMAAGQYCLPTAYTSRLIEMVKRIPPYLPDPFTEFPNLQREKFSFHRFFLRQSAISWKQLSFSFLKGACQPKLTQVWGGPVPQVITRDCICGNKRWYELWSEMANSSLWILSPPDIKPASWLCQSWPSHIW